MRFLLDTNVISEARKPGANPNVIAWLRGVSSEHLFLSVLVLGELRQGVERLQRRDPIQAQRLSLWLERLRLDYADRLLPISAEVAEEWGRLNAIDPLPVIDGMLAATARHHALTVVTRNTRDFTRAGVSVIDPFVR